VIKEHRANKEHQRRDLGMYGGASSSLRHPSFLIYRAGFIISPTMVKLIERSKKEAVVAIENVTGALLENVNRGVAQVYSNQQKLESESKALQIQTARFAK
jgi:hypothetical protein